MKLRNTFNNNILTDLKLSKAQISKIIQSGRFLGSLLSKLAGPLMKVAAPSAKNILAPLGVTAAASAIDAVSGIMTQKLVSLKRNLLIIIMTSVLLLQSLIISLLMLLMQN